MIRGLAALAAVATLGVAATLASLPEIGALDASALGQTEFMRWRAQRLGDPMTEHLPSTTSPDEIPDLLLCAIVAAEDHRFFQHGGIDWVATRKALTRALQGHALVGASTITQQLARNLYLTGERSWLRKLQEAVLARRLETRLDKPQILRLYANRVEWGRGVWGIGAAGEHYFGKAPERLSAEEIFYLTSLLAAPTAELEGDALDRFRARRRYTVRRLHRRGVLDGSTYQSLTGEPPLVDEVLPPEHMLSSGCGSIAVDPDDRAR